MISPGTSPRRYISTNKMNNFVLKDGGGCLPYEHKDSDTTEQTAEVEFLRGSSDLLSDGHGSVIILVADPRPFVGKFPINLCSSNS